MRREPDAIVALSHRALAGHEGTFVRGFGRSIGRRLSLSERSFEAIAALRSRLEPTFLPKFAVTMKLGSIRLLVRRE